MDSRLVIPALFCFVLAAISPAPAQSDKEEDDWEERDRKYLERVEANRAAKTARLTEAERDEFRKKFLEEARNLIKDRNYRSAGTGTYRVMTDDPRLKPDAMVGLLESFESFFGSFWEDRIKPRPYEDRSNVFLFYSFYKYNKILTGEERFGDFRPAGHYTPYLDMITLHTDASAPEDLAGTLVHEAAHQQVAMRLATHRSLRSLWLTEGLACYFQFTPRDAEGNWLAGQPGEIDLHLVKGVPRKRSKEAGERLKWFRQETKRNREWSLENMLVVNDPKWFYGEGAIQRYVVSWLLVHFLFHGENAAHSEAFVNYIKKEIDGSGGSDILCEELGMEPAELQDKLIAYAAGLKIK